MPYLKTMTADLLDACVNISHLTEVNAVDHNGLTVSVERKVLTKVTEFNFKLVQRDVEVSFTVRYMDGPFSVFGITVKLGAVKHLCYTIGGDYHSPTLTPSQLEQVSISTKCLVAMALEKPWSL